MLNELSEKKKAKGCVQLFIGNISQSYMGSNSVACSLTQVKALCRNLSNPIHTCSYLIYLPWKDERLS